MPHQVKVNAADRILRTIWKHPRSSRVAIADRLNLDKSTVTNQVNALIAKGIIEELEEGEASKRGGRKPIYLDICKHYGRVLGIEIQARSCVALELDLAGNILSEQRSKLQLTATNFVDIVEDLIRSGGYLEPSTRGPLLGVGVGSGGLINSKQSLIRYSVPLSIYEPLHLAAAFKERIPVPCFVENDANCCAWGELAFTRTDDPRNFIFALVEYRPDTESIHRHGGIGVGFGLVLGGKVYNGSHGNAGEFRSAFCDGPGAAQFSLGPQELAEVFSKPKLLELVCDEFARNLAVLVNTMDFEHVYVGGDIEETDLDFLGLLRRRLEDNWMYPFPKDIELRYSSLGARAVAYGAAGMLLDKLFNENLLHDL